MISIILSEELSRVVETTAEARGLTVKGLVVRALAVEEFFREQRAAGNTVLIEHPDGSVQEVIFP